MSRATKWKFEKTKVKVVFRLQFHATHIPQTGWDKLYISLIPAESGKATAKTTKANVRNGTCKWGDPIYETTRLLQDVKSKRFEEKLYKLVIAMGSSRSSHLGEASIDLADYADALKPTTVQLPLQGSSDSGAVLHVTVQLLTSKTGFREFEQQRETSERGLQASGDHDGARLSLSGDTIGSHIDKVGSRVKSKPEQKLLPPLGEEVGLIEEYPDLTTGLDGSSNTSGSLYAEKHDASRSHDVDSVKSTISGDMTGISLSQSPTPEKGDLSNNHSIAAGNNDWVHYYGSDNLVDQDLSIAYHEGSSLKGALEAAELSVHLMKNELTSLQTHTDGIGGDMQKLTERLANEISSSNELAKEVSFLKSECFKFRNEIEDLANRKISGLLSLEDKIRDLQNKAYIGFHDKDFRFLIPDLDSLLNILLDLKRGNGHVASPIDSKLEGEPAVGNFSRMALPQSNENLSAAGFGMDVCQPEGLLGLNIPGLVSQETDATKAMQGEMFKLLRELDESKSERESLARKMDQMECYYEALVQELEVSQKQMLGELQNLRNEHSTCLYTLSSSKAQMEAMHQDMSDQILRLAEERCNMDSLNKDLERRAVASEAALRRARLNYSIAVNQLQKDLEVLSLQVLSMYETNENLLRKAFSESLPAFIEKYPEAIQSENLNMKDPKVATAAVCQNQKFGTRNDGKMLLDDLNNALIFQEELYQKIEQEVFDINVTNIHLDLFARSLQETLHEAVADFTLKDLQINEVMKQLEHSRKSSEALRLKLQAVEEDIEALRKERTVYISREKELALHTQTLEANVGSLSGANHILAERIAECEAMVTESTTYKSRYEACEAEKTVLINTLEQATAENSNLASKISLLQEELKKTSAEFDELRFSKKNLHGIVDFLQGKLQNMLAAHGEKVGVPPSGKFEDLKAFSDVVSLLEDCQNVASEKILLLTKEKKDLEEERDIASMSLTAKKSEFAALGKKFEIDVGAMIRKLEASNVNMDNLQAKLDTMCGERLKIFLKAEESCMDMKEELLGDVSSMEAQLHELSNKSDEIAREICALGVTNEDIGGLNLTVAELTQEKQNLIACLQSKIDEMAVLESETTSLRETLRSVTDDLSVEKNSRERLENELSDATSELVEKNDKLLHFHHQEAELVRLRKQLAGLEYEKSRACNELAVIISQFNEKNAKLLQHEQQEAELVLLKTQLLDSESERLRVCSKLLDVENLLQEALDESSSSVANLEADIVSMQGQLIAADIRELFVRTHCDCQVQNLVHLLELSNNHVEDLNKKHLDLQKELNESLQREGNCATENLNLRAQYESMKSRLEEYTAQCKATEDSIERSYSEATTLRAFEVEKLSFLLSDCLSETDGLMSSKQELEIIFLVLKGKLDEQFGLKSLLEHYDNELSMLQKQHDELSFRLSEQMLKTEEFKNLSIHLKELKDKADAEVLRAREKREDTGSSVAAQESLRIAFIKEQYETKVQELRQQLNMSKKHGEEMLLKLQDAVDELENRRKAEASHLKRNEELSVKILNLEEELRSALSDSRDSAMAYDQIKAELECSLISLECCKEEKQKLVFSLQECNDERSRIAQELSKMKEYLDSSAAIKTLTEKKEACQAEQPKNKQATGVVHLENGGEIPSHKREVGVVESLIGHPKGLVDESLTTYGENGSPIHSDREHGMGHMHGIMQDTARDNELPSGQSPSQEHLECDDDKTVSCTSYQLKAQNLKSSMEFLHKELEKMKSENSILSEDPFEPHVEGLHRELMQLEKVTVELQNMSPAFNDLSGYGNSIERVLALVMELAEALQAKKASTIQFQSSFLKQHNDEAAIFRSFKDINDLVKDMLELKGKYNAVEAELKDMHERYSELSIQFAEVEGERQKLMMTLKNARSPRRLSSLSSLASPGRPTS